MKTWATLQECKFLTKLVDPELNESNWLLDYPDLEFVIARAFKIKPQLPFRPAKKNNEEPKKSEPKRFDSNKTHQKNFSSPRINLV